MSVRGPLEPLLSALRDLGAWIEAEGVPGVVIGGVAASVLGRPRVTRDIDAMVLLSPVRWGAFLANGQRFGFVARHAEPLAFAKRARVLLLRHEPSGIDIDVTFGALPFEEETAARARVVGIHGVRVPLPTPEDLMIMKAVAGRVRDLADIEALLTAHPNLDRRRVRRWVRAFADALERPEILENVERGFRQVGRRTPRRTRRPAKRRGSK